MGCSLTRDSQVSGLLIDSGYVSDHRSTFSGAPPFGEKDLCLGGQGRPTLNGCEGDKHDALASFTLELDSFPTDLGDKLAAFAARLAAVGGMGSLRFGVEHDLRRVQNEIENEY